MLQKVFNILVCMTLSANAWALSVSSRYNKNPQGAYYKEVTIQCADGEEQLCQTMCKSDTVCQRVEPYCLNCAGTTSMLLRQLFTQLGQNYKATDIEIPAVDFANYLASERYVLLGANSAYNYYTPANSGDLIKSLLALCPAGDEEALLAVALDEEYEPSKLSFVICKATDGTSKAYQVELNRPEVGDKPLRLKVKWKLRLP